MKRVRYSNKVLRDVEINQFFHGFNTPRPEGSVGVFVVCRPDGWYVVTRTYERAAYRRPAIVSGPLSESNAEHIARRLTERRKRQTKAK